MATYTTRNDLKKPDYTDAADIEDLNDNFDFIDGSIAPCNWAATGAPTVNDDITFGYIIGSIWFDTTNHKIYMCESSADGAAVWRKTYPSDSMVVTTSDPTVNDDSGDGYAAGQLWFNTATNYLFMAKSVSVGAAVWMRLTSRNSIGTSAPTVNSDTSNGYAIGSVWTDYTNKIRYICLDATTGAAVWKQMCMADTDFTTAKSLTCLGLTSTVGIGTPPIAVTSTTKVTNLNVDQVDGKDETAFALLAGRSGGQTLYGDTAKNGSLNLYSNSNGATGYINMPNANLVLGTKATTAPNFALAIHEGAAGAANSIYFMDGDGSTVRSAIFKNSGDTLCFSATDGSTADAYIAQADGKLYDPNGFSSTYTKTDPGNSSSCIGMTIRPTYTGAETAAETFYGVYDAIFPEIQAGHTNSGTVVSYYTECMRNHNGASTDDDGALTTLAALIANYGHYNLNTSMKGTTTTAMGMYIGPFCIKGTITNLIGLRINTPSTGGTITNQWPIYSDWNAQHYLGGDVYTTGNCSALSFTDRTPGYEGDGIADIKKIKNKNGQVDHDTLPDFARKKIEGKPTTKKVTREIQGLTREDEEPVKSTEESGRDLGAMISILVKAVQQLDEKLQGMYDAHDDAEKRMAAMEKRLAQLENKA